jgi:DNA modification methylase
VYNKSSEKMTEIKSNSVQVVFTSPPYYNLRNYGNSIKGKPELGLETSPEDFVINLCNHLKDVKRVLSETGSFFLNIGESYNKGENLLIPTRLLLQLCDKEGWYLVNEIIWRKTNPIPHPTSKRLQPTYEKIFHLVKDPENYYYQEFKLWNDNANRVVKAPQNRALDTGLKAKNGFTISKGYQKFKDFMENQTIADLITGPNAGSRQTELKKTDPTIDHPALMPDYLPVIPILTTSDEGDLILDPFSGSATTGKTALLFGRKYVGYELKKSNYELSLQSLKTTIEELKSESQ